MVTRAYIEYIRSPRWRAKRQQAFKFYGKKCYACRQRKRVMHVHHLTYARLGHEQMSDLMVLCKECHDEVTKIYRRSRRRGLRRVTMEFVKIKRASVR